MSALRKMKVRDKISHWEGRFSRYLSRSEGRTRAAGRANARCRTVERGWPEGRTHVAARSNAKIAPRSGAPAAQSGRGSDKPLILREAGPESPGNFSAAPLRVLAFRPRATARYLNEVVVARSSRLRHQPGDAGRRPAPQPAHPAPLPWLLAACFRLLFSEQML